MIEASGLVGPTAASRAGVSYTCSDLSGTISLCVRKAGAEVGGDEDGGSAMTDPTLHPMMMLASIPAETARQVTKVCAILDNLQDLSAGEKGSTTRADEGQHLHVVAFPCLRFPQFKGLDALAIPFSCRGWSLIASTIGMSLWSSRAQPCSPAFPQSPDRRCASRPVSGSGSRVCARQHHELPPARR